MGQVLFSTDRSKTVPLFQFFVRASAVSFVTFVYSFFVRHHTFNLCLLKSVLCECGIFRGTFTYVLCEGKLKGVMESKMEAVKVVSKLL